LQLTLCLLLYGMLHRDATTLTTLGLSVMHRRGCIGTWQPSQTMLWALPLQLQLQRQCGLQQPRQQAQLRHWGSPRPCEEATCE
jgi:hypothetical protein